MVSKLTISSSKRRASEYFCQCSANGERMHSLPRASDTDSGEAVPEVFLYLSEDIGRSHAAKRDGFSRGVILDVCIVPRNQNSFTSFLLF